MNELSYNFFMLSDPHLGDEESYDMNPLTNQLFRTKKDITRPRKTLHAFTAMLDHIAQTSDAHSQFLIEGGDLVEGGSYNADTHAEQLRKALELLETHTRLPVLPVNGNHDSWGNGGPEAFRRVVLPHIGKITGHAPEKFANYTVSVGPDLFILADAYALDDLGISFIHSVLDGLDGKPRHLFVVVHPHLMPYYNLNYIDLCRRLAQYDAVILGGHSHGTHVLQYERDGHRLTQFLIGTLLPPSPEEARYSVPSTDLDAFWAKYLPHHAPAPWQVQNIQIHWMPYIHACWIPKGMGYARLDISDAAIALSVQSADLSQPTLTCRLR